MQYDSGAEENRILIFGTEESKKVLELSENWQADGTFKVTPPIFAQVYSIHASLITVHVNFSALNYVVLYVLFFKFFCSSFK